MATLLQITGIFALLSFIYLSFVVAKSFLKLTDTMQNLDKNLKDMNNNINQVKDKIIETLDEVKILNEKLISSLDHFDDMSYKIGTSIQNIERKTDKFTQIFEPLEFLVQETYNKVSPAVGYVSSIVSATAKAVSTFANRLKK